MGFKKLSLALALAGVAGVGCTSWLSVKCSKKAEQETTKKGKIFAYTPAILCGIGTSACILGGHHVNRKTIAGLTTTCTYLTANRDKIRKAIEEKYGREELKDIDQKASVPPDKQIKVSKGDSLMRKIRNGSSIEWTGKGTLVCLDGYSGRMFYSSVEAVEMAQAKFNELFSDGNYVCFNDLYELYGIERTHFGHQYGYPANGDYYDYRTPNPIEFENNIVYDDDGREVLLIDLYTYPMEGWQEV